MVTPKILSKAFFCRNRFELVQFQTRFGNVEWHITDAETVTDAQVRAGELPEIVYQGSYSGALEFIKREQENLFHSDHT